MSSSIDASALLSLDVQVELSIDLDATLIPKPKVASNMAATTPVPPKNLKEWHSPSSRTEVINELINGVGEYSLYCAGSGWPLTPTDRYNPSNLSFMEDYLQNQVATGEYDLLANIAILKLCVASGAE